jgi:uncharacterized membrane protein YdjX (TVP38/TMEM64 family)
VSILEPIMSRRLYLAAGLALVIVAGLALTLLMPDDGTLFSEPWIRDVVGSVGMVGPIVLIVIMALAIVVSPIPSGPIAIAAGAVYGTLWGGVFTIAGALLGSCIAFGAARYLGLDAIRASQNPVFKAIAAPRSQWSLMAIVFASRLMPFISFDAVSYAAGVTVLTFGRFVAATLLGIIPVCFILSAVGAGMKDAEMSWPFLAIVGGITLVPVIGKWLWDKLR